MTQVFRPGGTALISGAASGIGFQVSSHCRQAGMCLHLLDVSASNLTRAKSILSELPTTADKPTITTHVIDVSDAGAWAAVKYELGCGIELDFLMLNAGASFKPEKGKTQWDEAGNFFNKTFGINTMGMVYGIDHFLPAMRRGSGKNPKAIVMTGSKQGITNPPLAGNPAYNASKAAVKAIAEHLNFDLSRTDPNISVHLLIPGWAFTGLSGNVGPTTDEEAMEKKPAGAWLPSQVKDEMVKGIDSKRFYIVCPDNDVSYALDKARMDWAVKEINDSLQPLSRWRDDMKDEAASWIDKRKKEYE